VTLLCWTSGSWFLVFLLDVENHLPSNVTFQKAGILSLLCFSAFLTLFLQYPGIFQSLELVATTVHLS
jgi:hypothetical protein